MTNLLMKLNKATLTNLEISGMAEHPKQITELFKALATKRFYSDLTIKEANLLMMYGDRCTRSINYTELSREFINEY